MKKKLGKKKVQNFRRSWNISPDPLSKNNPYHPVNIEAYKDVPLENIPDTESLKDTYERVFPYFKKEILSKLEDNKNILISAHGNSLRAICKFLFKLGENKIPKLEIPTGNPLFISFNDKNEITKCHYLDKNRAKDLIAF
jgi:2,3-bisphosphoglycerate-dependent phosphoglycerate mutase